MQNVVLFAMFLSIAILISIAISQKIDEVFASYDNKVRANAKELELLNQSLEQKVKEEIEKNREKEQLLVQKSKFIALGEMISNIAHQWRQPLSELSSILMFIKFKYRKLFCGIRFFTKRIGPNDPSDDDSSTDYMIKVNGFVEEKVSCKDGNQSGEVIKYTQFRGLNLG